MNLRILKVIIPVLVMALSASCDKTFNSDKWQPDMLMPLAKGTATIEDVADLKDKIFTQEVPPFDIGVFNIAVPVALDSVSLGYVGPYPYQVSEYFQYVYVDSAVFSIDYENKFPIVVKQGTRIDFRSSADTTSPSNIIFSHTLTSDIVPYGSYNFVTTVVNSYVPSIMYMYLQNFKAYNPTPGSVIFDNLPSTITFEIKFLSVFKIAVYTNKEYAVSDTVTIDYGDDFSPTDYNDSTVVGQLTLYLTNKMPINFDFQMYFWDASMSVPLDSFYYGRMNVPATITNTDGNPIAPVENSFPVPMTAARVQLLKQAKFMSYRLAGNTYGLGAGDIVVYASKECVLEAQMVGDIKIRIANLFSFL